MPEYEAWIPVTALVKVVLFTEEDLTDEETNDHKELLRRFQNDGEPQAHLCDDCGENIRIDEGSLEYEKAPEAVIDLQLKTD